MTSTTSTTPALLAELLNGAEDGAALFFDSSVTAIPDDFSCLGTTTDGVRARFITGGSGLSERAPFIPDRDRPLTDEELDAVLEAGGFKPTSKAGRLLEHFNELKVGQLIRVERKPLDFAFQSLESGGVYRVSNVGAGNVFRVEDSVGGKTWDGYEIWDGYDIYVLGEAPEDQPTTLTSQELEDLTQAHYANGYDDGHDKGFKDGHSEGVKDGYSKGVKDGYDEGVKNGYNEGYDDGRYEGVKDGRDKDFADGWAAFKRTLLVNDEVFDFWDDEEETAVESQIRVKDGYNEGVKDGHDEGFKDGYNEGFADGWVAFKRALLVADEVFDFWDDEKETAIESQIRVIEKAYAMRRVYWDTLGSPRTSQPQEASLRAWMEAFAEAEEA